MPASFPCARHFGFENPVLGRLPASQEMRDSWAHTLCSHGTPRSTPELAKVRRLTSRTGDKSACKGFLD